MSEVNRMSGVRPARDISKARPAGVPSLSKLPPDAHKGDAGRVLLLVGSDAMPGAAVLATRAALRGGAGLVHVACADRRPLSTLPLVAPEAILVDLRVGSRGETAPEALADSLARTLEEGRFDAVAAGPGLGATRRTQVLVERLLECFEGPILLDADALNVFAGRAGELARSDSRLVLTPHPGEAERLLGRAIPGDESGRTEAAVELAERTRATVLLKGAGSIVTDGDRKAHNPTGNPGLAKGGSGDVLTGLAAAYLARRSLGWSPFETLRATVWIHGRAGDIAAEQKGERGALPSDVIELLPGVQRALEVPYDDEGGSL
ncbi:MAG: NAD(P)H-hydrate dehydratase [Planctomycetota bacterium]|jgi:NAD(P)H-hydrate epimerase